MSNGVMSINITKRFDGNCKVYAFDVRIDDDVYREVSKDKAWSLVLQAHDVADDLEMFFDARGLDHLRAA